MPEPGTQPMNNAAYHRIWTPHFIILFAITLVTGLSAESLLTEAWLNSGYQSDLILSGHIIFILITLIVLLRQARSLWLQVGIIFGLLWSLFSLIGLFVSTGGGGAVVASNLAAAASSALLGFYISLSTHRMPLQRWDSMLFWLIPPLAGCILLLYVLLHPIQNGHIKGLIETTSTVLLAASVMLWWLRPMCWRTRPCPTFLFGLVPLLSIFVNYWSGDMIGTRLFLSQIALLCILLGNMRVIRAECQGTQQANRQAARHTYLASTEEVQHGVLYALSHSSPHGEQNQHDTNSIVEQVQQHARPE